MINKTDKICQISRIPITEGDRVLFFVIQDTDWMPTTGGGYRNQTFLDICDQYENYKTLNQDYNRFLETKNRNKPLNPFYKIGLGVYDGVGGVKGKIEGLAHDDNYYNYSVQASRSRLLEGDQEVWIHRDIAEWLLERSVNSDDLESDVITIVRLATKLLIPIWYLEPVSREHLTIDAERLRLQLYLHRAIICLLERKISQFNSR